MIAFTIRRLLLSIPILLASSLVAFWMASISADPVRSKYEGRNPPVPEFVVQAEYHRLGLDKGFWQQYWDWLRNLVLHGTFGVSIDPTLNIGRELASRSLVTLRLITAAMLIALILAIVTGVYSAMKQYSKFDYIMTFLGFVFVSMPAFWIAVILKQQAIAVNDAVEPRLGSRPIATTFEHSVNSPQDLLGKILDDGLHLILPTISLALITYAAWSRFARGSMLEVMNSDYVRLARAKGLSPRRVMIRHALRTALIPMTTVTALGIAATLGGAVITETIFQWGGMGQFLLRAITTQDRYILIGWLLVAGVFVIVGNLVADLLYAVLDPRIRYE
jgi:glutathione transport system permease protein